MGKKLIIAEKNSMARDIVSAIGGLKYNKSQDFYEGTDYVVVALSGHVLEWFDMQDYDEELKNWNIKELPYFPKEWKLKIKNNAYLKKKYYTTKKLIMREDIDEIINAGDPDNEGEVLVNEVIYKVFKENKITKSIKRLWILDHVPETINIEDVNNEKLEDKVFYSNISKEENQIVFLEDSQLLDYENQPFVTDVKEDNQELEESIKLNGIIEPIIVRPFNGKYQILSGHRRRMCGRNVGLTQFPCYIREKDDNEAKYI